MAPTRVRGRVLRFEYDEAALRRPMIELRVLRMDKKWGLWGGEGGFLGRHGEASLHGT